MKRFHRIAGILVLFLITFLLSGTISAEVYQLNTVTREEKATVVEELSSDELLDKERAKKFVIAFLRGSPNEKFRLLTEKHKALIKSQQSLKTIFNKESYDKIDFQEVKMLKQEKTKHMKIKADIYWFIEGHEGIQTFYFLLVKEKERWLLDWMIY